MEVPLAQKGNNPRRWERLLAALDEKLQLGLLEHLRRIGAYHFEGDVLYLQPTDQTEAQYFERAPFMHQLELLAKDSIGVTAVKIETLKVEKTE